MLEYIPFETNEFHFFNSAELKDVLGIDNINVVLKNQRRILGNCTFGCIVDLIRSRLERRSKVEYELLVDGRAVDLSQFHGNDLVKYVCKLIDVEYPWWEVTVWKCDGEEDSYDIKNVDLGCSLTTLACLKTGDFEWIKKYLKHSKNRYIKLLDLDHVLRAINFSTSVSDNIKRELLGIVGRVYKKVFKNWCESSRVVYERFKDNVIINNRLYRQPLFENYLKYDRYLDRRYYAKPYPDYPENGDIELWFTEDEVFHVNKVNDFNLNNPFSYATALKLEDYESAMGYHCELYGSDGKLMPYYDHITRCIYYTKIAMDNGTLRCIEKPYTSYANAYFWKSVFPALGILMIFFGLAICSVFNGGAGIGIPMIVFAVWGLYHGLRCRMYDNGTRGR